MKQEEYYRKKDAHTGWAGVGGKIGRGRKGGGGKRGNSPVVI